MSGTFFGTEEWLAVEFSILCSIFNITVVNSMMMYGAISGTRRLRNLQKEYATQEVASTVASHNSSLIFGAACMLRLHLRDMALFSWPTLTIPLLSEPIWRDASAQDMLQTAVLSYIQFQGSLVDLGTPAIRGLWRRVPNAISSPISSWGTKLSWWLPGVAARIPLPHCPHAIQYWYLRLFGVDIARRWEYAPIPEGRQIRLFKLKRWQPFVGVCGSLVDVKLDKDVPQYDAVSYHWGSSTETRCIYINGSCFDVSLATYDALASCRPSGLDRLVWIDYVCINQQDHAEKAGQVATMNEIFSKAQRAIVCLPDTPSCNRVHPLIRELHERPPKSDRDIRWITDTGFLRWSPLVELLNLPWFERVWVIQEVAAASKVQVRYGGWTYDWDYFAQGLLSLDMDRKVALFLQITEQGRQASRHLSNLLNLFQLRQRTKQIQLYRAAHAADAVQAAAADMIKNEELPKPYRRVIAAMRNLAQKVDKDLARVVDKSNSPAPLAYLLTTFHGFKATDPRDKVFALLNLLANQVPKSLAPNYSPSVTADGVYESAMRYVLQEPQGGLFALSFAGSAHRGRRKSLPSWVPDWSCPLKGVVLAPYPWDRQESDYRATDTTQPSNHDGAPAPGILELPGLDVDEILHVCSSFRMGLLDEPLSPLDTSTAYQTVQLAVEYMVLLMACSDAFATTHAHVADPYPFKEGQSRNEAFWRTLIGDSDGENNRPVPKDMGEKYDAWIALQKTVFASVLGAGLQASASDPEHAFLDSFKDVHTWAEAMGRCAASRRFCVTRAGYLGCVPVTAEVGDRVILIRGAHTPFIVRKREEGTGTYQLIGECYMHGMMDGELAAGSPEWGAFAFD